MKDLFSKGSKLYSTARPSYPDALISFILNITSNFNLAWDVGTGNGQLAALLAPYFENIVATDISKEQLMHAVPKANIQYKVQPAEQSDFKDNSVDLITIAQAVHWFDFELFYQEAKRVLSLNGIIAVVGYPLIKVDTEVDKVINYFHDDILGTYWDPECSYLDENYTTLPFPFTEIELPVITSQYNWTFDQLIAFLYTWSGLRHYINKNDIDPMIELVPLLRKAWGQNQTKTVYFPVIGRIGKL
ncbi:MAG TPA: class I SAM-dependent methyltransferase [Saprospiraceae bacterium]|nr:class I SAM-dependent methyltransferase [Saprospiraceae bacterium]